MPANARKDIVREGEIGTYHCWSRCVQRAFLCGYDSVTERDFDYRRGWIESLLAYLAGVFALDVGNFNILSNHLHALLRTRPDLALRWSAEEVAWRWKRAWPELCDGQWVREPTDAEVDALLAQPIKIEQLRRRLSSLSWFMARWKEPIARMCNSEMDTSGHFWEGRFHSRELLDDVAVLTCSFYVDLNQVQAGLADSLETSRHSAIFQRIVAAKAQEARASYEDVCTRDGAVGADFTLAQSQLLFADCYLAPLAVDGPLLTTDALRQVPCTSLPLNIVSSHDAPLLLPAHGETAHDTTTAITADSSLSPAASGEHSAEVATETSAPVSAQQAPLVRPPLQRRASDAPFIAMALSEYLRLARTLAARIVLSRSPPSAPPFEARDLLDDASLHETLRRWGLNASVWLAKLQQLDRQCTRALGTAERVLRRAREGAQQRFHGVGLCRELFAAPASEGFT
jgi:hypothetical protein